MTDVKPVATVRHGPTFGLAGSQVAPTLPGSIRQMRDAPFGKGKPFSSDTYHAPSGPMATAVGTASAGTGVPGGGPGNGRPSGHGTSSGLKRATVVILRRVSIFRRSLAAASVSEHASAREQREAVRVGLVRDPFLVVRVRIRDLVGRDVDGLDDLALAVQADEASEVASTLLGWPAQHGPDLVQGLEGDVHRAEARLGIDRQRREGPDHRARHDAAARPGSACRFRTRRRGRCHHRRLRCRAGCRGPRREFRPGSVFADAVEAKTDMTTRIAAAAHSA